MAKDEDDKPKSKISPAEENAGIQVPKPSGPVTQAEEEVDEFGLKIKHVTKRLYELPTTIEGAGKTDTKDDSDDENGDGFKTPLNGLDEKADAEGKAPQLAATQKKKLEDGEVAKSTDDQEALKLEVQEHSHSSPKVTVDEIKSPQTPDKSSASPDASRQHSMATTSSPVETRGVSEWSHMQLAPKAEEEAKEEDEGEWQSMPAFATHTIYDDWGKVLAREEKELQEEEDQGYQNLGGASRGYTKVQLDEDAMSATSMDDDTAYLFKQSKTTALLEEDEEGRDMLAQMEATKDLLTEGQRIAYVGVVKIATMEMYREFEKIERTRSTKKMTEATLESLKKFSQKIMVRLYGHMEIDSAEQVMIEQLAEHGVQADDLTPTLMQNARVRNPMKDAEAKDRKQSISEEVPTPSSESLDVKSPTPSMPNTPSTPGNVPAPYDEEIAPDNMEIQSPSAIADQKKIDIDLRWTVLCDLFLVLVADSSYDARSRTLLEYVGKALQVDWLDICRFEKRITDALEMQEAADKENWNEEEHMQQREKSSRNRKLMMMGLATVGGGLVIGLSAGLLAPVIGAGFAAGFTTIGIAGTGSFFGGVGAAALITSTGVITGSSIGIRASSRRMGAVKTFEYRPLHNNKRVNLIVTIAGWMTGKVDDVRLPFSTVDPIMGDIYSVLWEPEMLQSMGQTINILATEALTQGLQQILGSTILVALMAALQLPVMLTKLAYLIDNPWNVSLARADQAGLILADSLMEHNLGARPITLCGFSIGARVIYACLKELAKRGQYGLIQNVYLYGSPMVANKDDYIRARSVVSGRFLNGYATNDWILGYLFRATSGGIMRVAGLAPVEIQGIENVDVTQHVPGHMSYRAAMPKLLQEAGWAVESLEFSEIEDPDPENHEKRQRELINEIEEARKQLEKKPSKKGLKALFSRNKKLAEKKEWETYDERTKTGPADGAGSAADPHAPGASPAGAPVMFDVDAILKEVAELSAQGVEVKEIQSTLPPLKVNVEQPAPARTSGSHSRSRSRASSGSQSPRPRALRTSSSFTSNAGVGAGGGGGVAGRLSHKSSRSSLGGERNGGVGVNGGMLSPASPKVKSAGGWWRRGSGGGSGTGSKEKLPIAEREVTMTFENGGSRKGNPAPDRPGLYTAQSASAGTGGKASAMGMGVGAGALAVGGGAATAYAVDHNAWADEDESGNKRDGEMEMTFE